MSMVDDITNMKITEEMQNDINILSNFLLRINDVNSSIKFEKWHIKSSAILHILLIVFISTMCLEAYLTGNIWAIYFHSLFIAFNVYWLFRMYNSYKKRIAEINRNVETYTEKAINTVKLEYYVKNLMEQYRG